MRFVNCVNLLLVLTVLVLTSYDVTCAGTGTDQTNFTRIKPNDPRFSTRRGLDDNKRYLRRAASTTVNGEEREFISARVRIALKRLVTSDDTIYTHGIGIGGEKGRWATILKNYRIFKNEMEYLLREVYWEFVFLVWAANKRTPAMMYTRLGVIKTTGPYDKNYRIYIRYLSFYEHYVGPAYNPIHQYGPKLQN
ncbi:hypothetical protein L917_06667 [Phytophthora nicotianae]|uniref:RxLR effector protein n=1 Tax=Phytophthora nicotianae TaxID=4792 RepID=W2LFX0_PHYNI|nr:hypothetical protein L917_06667 [Phytophthora nicotianae]